jgi:hypothetical protein
MSRNAKRPPGCGGRVVVRFPNRQRKRRYYNRSHRAVETPHCTCRSRGVCPVCCWYHGVIHLALNRPSGVRHAG